MTVRTSFSMIGMPGTRSDDHMSGGGRREERDGEAERSWRHAGGPVYPAPAKPFSLRLAAPLEVPAQRARRLLRGARANLPVVQSAKEKIERKSMPRPVAVAPEYHVRPPAHADRRVPVISQAQPLPCDGANEHPLVPRARQRAKREQIRPRAEAADTFVAWRAVVKL